jgi:hypothetical protein
LKTRQDQPKLSSELTLRPGRPNFDESIQESQKFQIRISSGSSRRPNPEFGGGRPVNFQIAACSDGMGCPGRHFLSGAVPAELLFAKS